jgi:hypothetical protein
MAADITKSIPHLLEDLFLNGGIKDIIVNTALSVTVPSITDPDIAKVDVTVTGVAAGDSVLAADPTVALPTNARFQSAYVSATDTVTFVFGSEGGNVTGAAKTFTVIIADRT